MLQAEEPRGGARGDLDFAGLGREMAPVRESVEPTNNAAERALRAGTRWRRRSYGTMSERGSRFAERILTIAATLRQRGADALAYIAAAITAHLAGESPPPLPKAG